MTTDKIKLLNYLKWRHQVQQQTTLILPYTHTGDHHALGE
jgi:hypothetical protein